MYDGLEERNYANDHRVLALGKRWWASVDEDRMVAMIETEAKPWVHTMVRFEYITCPTCEGKGTHVNPSVDASGLTGDDMSDPDFRDDYLSGVYNVPCYHCHAKRVIPQALGEEWLEQDNGQALMVAFGLAHILTCNFDLPVPPCDYGHLNCSCDGLHGGTCWDETYQELHTDGLIDESTSDIWIPEGMKIDLHTIHAVIANLCSEHEDTGEMLTIEMEEALDASNPEELAKLEDLRYSIGQMRPVARSFTRRLMEE
jgi:hypothetical protein